MKRFLRTAFVGLGVALTLAVTSGCIVVPAGGGYYEHPHYWQR